MSQNDQHLTTPRVAVIGCGYWGRNIVRNLDALGALAAIIDPSPEARDFAGNQYPAAPVFGNTGDVLGDPKVDAVAIATPAATHGALVEEALTAGKHVFVEKPLCLDLIAADRLREEALGRNRILMVGHLLLYHPAFRALLGVVRDGALGRLRYIYSTRASLGKIRREENALWSFAPHDISMILQLAGAMPRSVIANGGQYLTDGVADTTLTHFTFDDTLQAHIFVSWLHPFKDHRLVVVGERAMAVFNDVAQGPEKLLLYRHKAQWDGDLPVVNKADPDPIPYAPDEALRVECEAFLDAVRTGLPPLSDGAEGVRVLTVLEACQRALAQEHPVMFETGAS